MGNPGLGDVGSPLTRVQATNDYAICHEVASTISTAFRQIWTWQCHNQRDDRVSWPVEILIIDHVRPPQLRPPHKGIVLVTSAKERLPRSPVEALLTGTLQRESAKRSGGLGWQASRFGHCCDGGESQESCAGTSDGFDALFHSSRRVWWSSQFKMDQSCHVHHMQWGLRPIVIASSIAIVSSAASPQPATSHWRLLRISQQPARVRIGLKRVSRQM